MRVLVVPTSPADSFPQQSTMSSTIDFQNVADSGRLITGLLLLVLDSNKLNENDFIIQEECLKRLRPPTKDPTSVPAESLWQHMDDLSSLEKWSIFGTVNYFSRVLDFQTFEYVPIWTTNYKWRQIVNSNLVDPRKLHERAAPSAWWRLLYSTVVWSFIYSPSLIAPPCTLEYVIQGTSATVHVYCQVAL